MALADYAGKNPDTQTYLIDETHQTGPFPLIDG